MTSVEIEAALALSRCTIVEDHGEFALVYPYGFENRKRSHDLQAATRAAALDEAWLWLHPEIRLAELIEIIQRVVARDFGLSMETLLSESRVQPIPLAKHIAMTLCRELTPAGQHQIGDAFLRDHRMVMHAQQVVADRCSIDERFAARLGALRAQCQAAFTPRGEKL